MTEARNISLDAIAQDIAEKHIAPHLGLKDLKHLTETSKTLNILFKHSLIQHKITLIQAQLVDLLQYVAHDEQDRAERLIKARPELLFLKSEVTDYSDRTFNMISPFQYAAWSYDMRMLDMMQHYIPKDYRQEALKQIKELEEQSTEHGKHFDFIPFLYELEIYVKRFPNWSDHDRAHHWIIHVGRLQRFLPAHVIKEYCQPNRSFAALPKFKKNDSFSDNLTFVTTYYSQAYLFSNTHQWFPLDNNSGLGTKYGITGTHIYKRRFFDHYATVGNGAAGVTFARYKSAKYDLKAIKKLSKVRHSEWNKFCLFAKKEAAIDKLESKFKKIKSSLRFS